MFKDTKEFEKTNTLHLYHFINRLINPLVNLKTQESIELFLNQEEEHKEITKFMVPKGTEIRSELMLDDTYQNLIYKTRIIVFIYNKGDYDEELDGIREDARKSALMLNMRIALVSDPKLVKRLKKETSWFGDASMNTMILKRYDGEIMNLDLLQINSIGNAYFWMWKKSIKDVEELNE